MKKLFCVFSVMVTLPTHTSLVPASHCAQAAPVISFIFKIMILKRKRSFCTCLDMGYFSHDRQELTHSEDGKNHHFCAAQASTRTWEGAHVSTGWCCAAHQPGSHGERMCWNQQSCFVSLTTASTSTLGDACTGRQTKEDKDARKSMCVAREEVHAGALKLCPWGEQENSPAKGAAAKFSFQIATFPTPFYCRFSPPIATRRALFNHLALATTFAWVSVPGMPVSDFYRLIHCIITFTHHGSQALPSNGFCISSYYREI